METSTKFILFKLDDQDFGIEVNHVISIERLQTITVVPGTAKYIKGLISLRGEILPIIDLKERLSFTQKEQWDDNRILVLKTGDIQAGLIIDEASEVVDINISDIESSSSVIGDSNHNFVNGITKLNDKLIILLDLEKILNSNIGHESEEVVEHFKKGDGVEWQANK